MCIRPQGQPKVVGLYLKSALLPMLPFAAQPSELKQLVPKSLTTHD